METEGNDVTEVLASLKAWVEKAESKQERALDEFVKLYQPIICLNHISHNHPKLHLVDDIDPQ